ncbi:hypothetical protein MNBD_IGNAVI01-2831 [hydrothermal vent metagenome]|uniref:Transposase IS4-like domain-containing protein n=1 Tax=hydrothermal vent metagenome TaxID=652676 RepID=A0A3B1D7T1_9ZZZZ
MNNADKLMEKITHGTILGHWFEPFAASLDKVRFSHKRFSALSMKSFILSGCIRQIQNTGTMCGQLQSLFHFDTDQSELPVKRSTYSDALASPHRRDILREGFSKLLDASQSQLADRFIHIPDLPNRPIIATDVTYQAESSHFTRVVPKEGGTDNQKGHALLTHFDMRTSIPIGLTSTTCSLGEMRILKENEHSTSQCMQTRHAIHVVDRAFIDGKFWDLYKQKYKSTVITRMKSSLKSVEKKQQPISPKICNKNIRHDKIVEMQFSKKPWRLIGFVTDDGTEYEYLTNDFDLEPGIVAFLYYRRWDEEKYFDTFKNDLSGKKAWSKSAIGIEQQALLGMITLILTRLFLVHQQLTLALDKPDHTQDKKYKKKKEHYFRVKNGVALRAFFEPLSKISKQIWRFLKDCFMKDHSLQLYQRQLKPMLLGYL